MKVSGTVRSKSGETVGFASVYRSDAEGNLRESMGTVADVDGRYLIQEVPNDAYLTASAIGYRKQTKPLAGFITNNVILDFSIEPNNTLNTVVISGERPAVNLPFNPYVPPSAVAGEKSFLRKYGLWIALGILLTAGAGTALVVYSRGH